jgi:CubicO group peptidase (beta-lactamase class C family)
MSAKPSPLPVCNPADVGIDPLRCQRLLDVLQDEINAQRLPGAVALIARRGKIALFESLGHLDPATGAPMAKDSIFRIYSMTKPLVYG